MSTERLFLLDGHALCYRSFFAIKGLATRKGQPTNAVFGFVNTLRKIFKDYHPEYLAVCFDSKEKTHRTEKFADYKIQRPKMPDDLITQMAIIKDVVKAYHLTLFECPGFEADDIIASICEKMKGEDLDIVIVSDDKDMFQLANERTKFLTSRQDNIMDYTHVKEQLGFEPKKIVDYLALAGDKIDNIPGVHGIGEVTATGLIERYGSLDQIFKNLETITPPAVQQKIKAQKEAAILSKELAILHTEVPLNIETLEDLQVKAPDQSQLFKIFRDLEFKKFADEFNTDQKEKVPTAVQRMTDSSQLKNLIEHIKKQKQFAFLLTLTQQLLIDDGKEIYAIDHNDQAQLKALFEDSQILKITHNLKETFKSKLPLKQPFFDVMLAAYLLNPTHSHPTLVDLAWEYCQISLKTDGPEEEAVKVLLQLYPLLSQGLEEKSLTQLLTDIEMPLASVLAKMEGHGVRLDTDFLLTLSLKCDQQIQKLMSQLYEMAGEEFNLNSPKQLSRILFEKLKMPVVRRTKTGFSTDEEVLSILAKNHKFAGLILEYRQLAKLKSTYIDAFPKLINSHTGRLHAEFDQTGTETGRLSSRHPNLQNIPIRTELGQQIRKAIIPSGDDLLMMSADYSQVELRILAHLSGDKNLIEAFVRNDDIHQFTASLIFDVAEDHVTSQMRNVAKRVNFGIIYGMSAFGLAKDLNISNIEAQEFIDRYFLRYPDVRNFLDQEIKKCEKNGFVATILNRRRYIPEINSQNNSLRQFAQRQAINAPVQGSAADLMKLAMIRIQDEMEKLQLHSRMLITVHDELVFDLVKKEQDLMANLIRQKMEHTIELSVPIKVSVKVGKNWLEMEEI